MGIAIVVDASVIYPASCLFRPAFYAFFLDLSKLLFSFETVFWRSELICANFCSRE